MARVVEQGSVPARSRSACPDGLRSHRAAVIGSDDELLAGVLPYAEEGLRRGDLVVLSCPPETAELIGGALGERARAVESDPRLCLLGSNVPDSITATGELVERAGGAGSGALRVVGQVQFGAEARNWREGLRYESAVNDLLVAQPVAALCLFDRRVLPAEVVAGAAATHPELQSGSRSYPSPAYQDPVEFVRTLPLPREAIEDGAPRFAVDASPSLVALRHALRAALAACVPDENQSADLQFAVSEIAANAFRHGAPPISARLWADPERVVCTVTDRGRGFDEPFAGFRPAHGEDLSRGGMGLWLARKLWDHVDLLPAGPGLTVRLSTRLR
ncbi:sensor histidine kinase [Blastococcus xanthinilyticus]|uniref:Anti-sigma regulatory factor (Ser/Thr protein kinase) n=1 Tax=Blastococcus xanthinilyticus TaxID=1564164 RepID=A0A5S5CU94_9ACTN|nr:sensor histidine kinase [Blastococcus xanthinilyticus]TYP86548.1 anti-sigma regulatory factor (Ser/Thr protein kinase) [Blastococcus xanthinilyticus]